MAKDKLPCWHFYPGDWFKDTAVQALDHLSRDVWHTLLLHMFESEKRGYLMMNGLGISDEMIANLVHLHINRWKKVKKKLVDTGVASLHTETGVLFNRRMVRDEEDRQLQSKKGKQYGHLGGNPEFEKGKRNPYYDKAKDNPPPYLSDKGPITQKINSSSSSSSSSSKKERKDPDKSTVDAGDNSVARPTPPSPVGLAPSGERMASIGSIIPSVVAQIRMMGETRAGPMTVDDLDQLIAQEREADHVEGE